MQGGGPNQADLQRMQMMGAPMQGQGVGPQGVPNPAAMQGMARMFGGGAPQQPDINQQMLQAQALRQQAQPMPGGGMPPPGAPRPPMARPMPMPGPARGAGGYGSMS